MSALRLGDRIAFYEELKSMVSAGFVFSQALRTLRDKRDAWAQTRMFRSLEEACASGQTFADAMADLPGEFDDLEVNLVRAGEQGGRLEETLKSLAEYFRRRQEIRRRIMGAVIYPIFLIHVAIVVPPAPLVVSEGVGAYLQSAGLAFLVVYGIAGAIWGFTLLVRNVPVVSDVWDRVRLAIPWYGNASRKFAVARFATSLGHLLDSGVSAPKAMELSAATLGIPTWRRGVLGVIPRVSGGDRIVDSIESAGFLPPNAAAIMLAGEESGQLPECLFNVAKMMEEEGSHSARIGSKVAQILALMVAIGFGGFQLLRQALRMFSGAVDQLPG